MITPTRFRTSLSAWLQLVRPPNLPTVPGDPLAGFLLAQATSNAPLVLGMAMWIPLAVALLLYTAGLIWNDAADVAEDRRDRPGRPIADGRVSRRSAALTASSLAACALGLAATHGVITLATAAVLTILILSYDLGLKRIPVVGELTMGLCRGTSLLLGAAAAPGAAATLTNTPVVLGACVVTVYVAGLTAVARHETKRASIGLRLWIAPAALILGLPLVLLSAKSTGIIFPWLAAAAACLWSGWCAWRLRDAPAPSLVQAGVGRFVRGLILAQAALCAGAPGGLTAAAAILCMWPLSVVLAKRFYAS